MVILEDGENFELVIISIHHQIFWEWCCVTHTQIVGS